MDLETLRTYTLSKKAVTEDMPFGEDTLVFRVLGKIFALTGLDIEGCRVNLKCDPDYAIELREQYDDIIPGYHMNKKHWNTVICDNALDDKFIRSLIDHSYDMVVKSMPKAQRMIIDY